MKKKNLPKSIRKFIRKEKARIRREVFDIIQQQQQIDELYKKFFKPVVGARLETKKESKPTKKSEKKAENKADKKEKKVEEKSKSKEKSK